MQEQIYTVSGLTREIKEYLENSFPRLWVEGEISNFKRHSSGHLYFSLKDEKSQIRCAMWRFRAGNLLFRPEDGMKVVVQADLQVYEAGGSYQLIVQQIQPAGIGELKLAFEQLKKRLQKEGLFEESHKQNLPLFPERIGVVTSPTGAAIRDIISVVSRRYPLAEIVINPVRVQGPGSKEEIVQAIREFNDFGDVDVLIVGRGGGSLEDLWSFNEEAVARAIFDSKIPVVSAVGHEIDFSIADFVSDQRAPTPSAAAEMVVPNRTDLLGNLAYYREKFLASVTKKVRDCRLKILSLQRGYAFRKPEDLVFQKLQRLDELWRSLQIGQQHIIKMKKNQLRGFQKQLLALSPQSVLERGYSICYKDSEVIKDSRQLHPLDAVQVKLAKGHFISQVQMIGEGE